MRAAPANGEGDGPGAAGRPLRVGVSACFFHPEDRPVFKGKTLLYAEQSMLHWVASAGALPWIVPTLPTAGPVGPAELVADLDGLLLHGGADLCPRTYGEEPLRPEWEGDQIRDRYELALVEAFTAARKPVLGICRGIQLINVAFGGTLWQDLPSQRGGDVDHRVYETYDGNRHEVDLLTGGGLARLYGEGDDGTRRAMVSSVHHQAIRDVAPGLVVEAVSPVDEVVEAVRLDAADRWVLGVQWHPEFTDPSDTEVLDRRPLMSSFLDACRSSR
jgi:putative glutamine amidotransferase